MDYQLRLAEDSDRVFLYSLYCSTMRDVVERTWGWDEEWQERDFRRRVAACETWIVEVGGKAVGGLMLDFAPRIINIVELQILPEHQGRGIGSYVLGAVIDRASKQRAAVTLSVVRANIRAKRLYDRIGFQVDRIDGPFVRMRYAGRQENRLPPWRV
jgi:ribosomal protein S18 acetylase RimI-like enzyme